MSKHRLSVILLIISIQVCALHPAPLAYGSSSATQQEQDRWFPADILNAIQELESSSDPKCHSTACRFEDFVYGTPLSVEAREAKIQLQKSLIRSIWLQASENSARAGLRSISKEDVERVAKKIVSLSSPGGNAIKANFPQHEFVEISPVHKRQIGSIAYSLRAVLAVHQDTLLEGVESVLPLSDQAVKKISQTVDVVTLSALKIADENARLANSKTITAKQLIVAWSKLVPSTDQAVRAIKLSKEKGKQIREQTLAMIDGKLRAYLHYNESTPREFNLKFANNVSRFYALYTYPIRQPWIERLDNAFKQQMRDFAKRLLTKANALAEVKGRPILRIDDATAAVNQVLPHKIDDFEDVTFFDGLTQQTITLESYDCDSFRDTGLHWIFLKNALHSMPSVRSPDPFASEVLTEAISGYGVLLYRVAGKIANDKNDAPALRASHLEAARKEIERLVGIQLKNEQTKSQSDSLSSDGVVSANTSEPNRVEAGQFFSNQSATVGVNFRHDSSAWLHQFRRDSVLSMFPTFSGGGVASEDIDGDGNFDLLFIGGDGNAVFFGNGKGKFERDDELSATLSNSAECRQPLIVDFNNDGLQDILITCVNAKHRLFRGTGNRTFNDVSEMAGLGGENTISGAATTFDFDNDGLLDVYIGCFGNYLSGVGPKKERDNRNGLSNKLLRNLGEFKFQDVTAESGADDSGWCQAVSHLDFDRDGLQDIFVANDFGRNSLLRNLGDGKFKNVGPQLGHTKAYHSMNVGITDLNQDGFPDIYVSNIATMVKDNKYTFPDATTNQKLDLSALSNMLVKEANMMYVSKAANNKLESYAASNAIERGESTTGWAWDAEFFDFDNDGDDDLYVANGLNDYNTYSAVVSMRSNANTAPKHFLVSNRREANVFFENVENRLQNRSSASGANFSGNSRSTAYLDWDHDGDLDIATNNFQSDVVMLQNEVQNGFQWMKVKLVGNPGKSTNRDAIGARIVATNPDGLYVVREIQGGSGYLSQNPKIQHFGIGQSKNVNLQIVWPNGQKQIEKDLSSNKLHVIHQR